MMKNKKIFVMNETYQEYLTDESRYKGWAESISFPESEAEILEILQEMRESKTPITIQGGKTGIVGAGIPNGGHIMNLSRMNQCRRYEVCEDKTALIWAEPGVNLMELKKAVGRISGGHELFWPPEPTEASATVGGMAASNAKGITQFLYGDTRQYIAGVRMIAWDGSIYEINSPSALSEVLGREGITGIFSELTLKLILRPPLVWGITFFFATHQEAEMFISRLLLAIPKTETAQIAAIEYLDRVTIDLIEERKDFLEKIKGLPDINAKFNDIVYLELQGEEEGIEEIAEQLMELAAAHGSDPDQAWAVSGAPEIEKMHAFRHAAAEASNLFIDQVRRQDARITKLSADMTLKDEDFKVVVPQYRKDVKKAGLKCCIFGHAAGIHLHINILPENYEEYLKGAELLRVWAKRVQKGNGEIVSEHGVGKLKKEIYNQAGNREYLADCKKIKQHWDPEGMFNQGNIFDRV